jgi:hypothetical protein
MTILKSSGCCLLLLTSTIHLAARIQPGFLRIPKGAAITLDGKLEDEEWKNAVTHELVGGGQVLLQHDGRHLFVGIKGVKEGWSHLYLTNGQDVFVLHASAALGATTYSRQSDGTWQPTQPFKWELRDRSLSQQANAAREDYLQKHGWVATVARMRQATDPEFKVAARLWGGGKFRLAVIFISAPEAPQYWPKTLADDSLKRELLAGNTPAGLKFNSEVWASAELQ